MKGNIKKLAVLVIIAAIAMFIPVAMTPVDVNAWNILGNYAFTGSNQCLVAPFGFDSNLNANPPPGSPAGTPGVWVTDLQSWEGSYRFHYNGTGEVNIIDHDFGATPGAGGSVSIYWKFNYTVAAGGRITFTSVPDTYKGLWLTGPMKGTPVYLVIPGSWDGVVSEDGNNIIVTWGAPLILYLADSNYTPIGVQLICNGSFVLIR